MNGTTMGLRISSRYLCAFKLPSIKCNCVCCPLLMPTHTITPPPPWGTLFTTLTSAHRSPTQRHTRGLRLWGRLDALQNSPKQCWRRLMVEKLTLYSLATALVDIPAVSMPIACSLKTETSVALCCVTELHILEWPFIVPSTRCTCVMRMLSWYATPVRWMDYLGKGEMHANRDVNKCMHSIWEK